MTDAKSPAARFTSEVREWAVRVAAIEMKDGEPATVLASVARRTGCTVRTLQRWIVQAEKAGGIRPGVFTDPHRRVRDLEAQLASLRQDHARLRLDRHREARGDLIVGAREESLQAAA